MRVCFLCTSGLDYPSPRGRWLPIARELVRLGHEPHLLMLHPTYDRLGPRSWEERGVHMRYVGQMHVYGLPGERRALAPAELLGVSLRGALALATAARRLRPDVVHVAKPQPINGLAGLLARRAARLMVDCDDYEAGANRFGAPWQRRAVQLWEDRLPPLAAAVSVNTRFLYRRSLALGVPEARLRYVPNGVSPAQFERPPAAQIRALRAALGLDDRPTAIYLGALSSVAHGVGLLLDAFALVLRDAPDARLLLVGDGDDRPALVAQARALGIGHALLWAGRVPAEAARAYLALADCSVDPVFDEPAMAARSPLKIVESMAQGVPVVTGDVGDRREVLGEGGLITPAGDARALAGALAAALGDAGLRGRLASAARERAEAYRWERLVGEWAAMY